VYGAGLAVVTVCILLAHSAAFGQLFDGAAERPVAISPPAPPEAEEVEAAVEQTADLLDGGLIRPTRPWYDAKTDGVRRLDMKLQRQSSWNFPWMAYVLKALGWFGVAVLVVLAGLILWRVFTYWRSSGEEPQAASALDEDADQVDRIEALPFRVARQPTDLLDEARRQYENGHYNEAIVYLFSHQLVVLDKQHLIHLARGKTNRQLVREIGARRELRLLVEQTMVAFEDVFFGDHALGRARFEACWFDLERFDRLVKEAAG
jgi:hypothetical protein